MLGAKDLADAAMAEAMLRVLTGELGAGDPLIRRSERADYQSNAALGLAKKAGIAPRELAQSLLDALDADLYAELSGPGFLNLTLSDAALWNVVAERLADERMGVGTLAQGTRTLVDYSGPNIAKQLHVGHIRSTVIGDALVRVLTYVGADVVKANHLGDWGTSFGKLIQYLDEHTDLSLDAIDLDALDDAYKSAQHQFVADPEFATRARARVVALQGGDEETLAAWRRLIEVSTDAFQALYQRLGILLTPEDAAPESFYNPWLDDVVSELDAKGLLTESEGAQCVFLDGFADAEGVPLPLIVRKSDGGYGYAATDLAAVRYRVDGGQGAADAVRHRREAGAAPADGLRDRAARRAGCRTRSRPYTSRSARSSAPTAGRSSPGPATRRGSRSCWTPRSPGPGPSSPRRAPNCRRTNSSM